MRLASTILRTTSVRPGPGAMKDCSRRDREVRMPPCVNTRNVLLLGPVGRHGPLSRPEINADGTRAPGSSDRGRMSAAHGLFRSSQIIGLCLDWRQWFFSPGTIIGPAGCCLGWFPASGEHRGMEADLVGPFVGCSGIRATLSESALVRSHDSSNILRENGNSCPGCHGSDSLVTGQGRLKSARRGIRFLTWAN